MKKLLILCALLALAFLLSHTRYKNVPPPPSLPPPQPKPAAIISSHQPSTIPPIPPILPTEPPSAPPPIRPILDPLHDFATRQKLARSLPTNLTRPELDALYSFLSINQDEDNLQLAQSLKSDLMDALCAQSILPIDLTKLLARIFHDPSQNPVIRDYALQHLATLAEKFCSRRGNESFLSPWPPAEIQSQLTQITNTLWLALNEIDSSIAGTALVSLHRLSKNQPPNPGDPGPQISAAALNLARDPRTGVLTRISAIQICAERGLADALPFLSQTARADPDLSTRISAIAALGRLGGPNEKQLLTQFANENNPRLTPAVTLALNRLQHRSP